MTAATAPILDEVQLDPSVVAMAITVGVLSEASQSVPPMLGNCSARLLGLVPRAGAALYALERGLVDKGRIAAHCTEAHSAAFRAVAGLRGGRGWPPRRGSRLARRIDGRVPAGLAAGDSGTVRGGVPLVCRQ